MITGYALDEGCLRAGEDLRAAVWVDLLAPGEAERAEIAALVGVTVPTLEDQLEIELSSRLYVEHGAAVMTALLPAHTKEQQAEIGPVTFILTRERLVTVRPHDPRPFATFPPRADRAALPCCSPESVLLGLTEEIIGRLADLTEYGGRKIESLSNQIFRPVGDERPDLKARLHKLGWRDELVTHVRDSLVSLERLLVFLGPILEARDPDGAATTALNVQLRDIRTISEQAGLLHQKLGFLLDATLGLISIEQNAIIKIFSIVAVVFLPPTLVASIYGMNFADMPELGWHLGYPLALLAMAVSAAIPLIYFKRKGWF